MAEGDGAEAPPYNRAMQEPSREPDESRPAADEPPDESLSAWQIVASSLAAAFGVQSSRNRRRDFSRGRAVHFIIAGVVLTALFVLLMAMLVSLVLSGVG